jgi:hypothetical protein
MTIVYRANRPKRARNRKAQAATVAVPVIVRGGRRPRLHPCRPTPTKTVSRQSSPRSTRDAGVPRRALDMTPEEHQRRGDAADALFREIKRQIAEKSR